ncbi:MAG TPA: hypothetical protein VFP56_08375 [Candidatus Limnocylindrales bacterium]|nr:hypothetical protein [Candidatus Limnocylindrales bacterium]
MRLRGFVPVEELDIVDSPSREGRRPERHTDAKRARVARPRQAVGDDVGGVSDDWEQRVSLFGEADVQ